MMILFENQEMEAFMNQFNRFCIIYIDNNYDEVYVYDMYLW